MSKEYGKRGTKPTKYTPELGDQICELIAEGLSLTRVHEKLKADGAEYSPTPAVINTWALKIPEFTEQYSRARIIQAHCLADDILAICDDGSRDTITRYREDGTEYDAIDHEHINRSRLRVDTRKWYLSKVLPKLYGDRIEVNSTGEVTHTHIVSVPRLESREEWLKAIETTAVAAIEHDDTESE